MTPKASQNKQSQSNGASNSGVTLPPGFKLHTRNLLTAYVNHNKETALWITTINTSQEGKVSKRSAKHLQAFSFRSEHEARESAYVNAPPKLTELNNNCFSCEKKTSGMFRRPTHCRNCGVCICNSCSRTWSKVMVPDTYNTAGTKNVKVCKTCDYLSAAFRHALIKGNYDAVIKIYMTGNINLRCPFLNVKKGKNGSEIM
jgi:hypothetical protein